MFTYFKTYSTSLLTILKLTLSAFLSSCKIHPKENNYSINDSSIGIACFVCWIIGGIKYFLVSKNRKKRIHKRVGRKP